MIVKVTSGSKGGEGKMRLLLSVVSASMMLFATAARADDCDAAFANGTMQTTKVNNSSYYKLVYASRLFALNYNEARHFFSQGGGIEIPGIGSLNERSTQDDFNRSKSQLEHMYNINEIRNNESSLLIIKGDEVLARAWSDCKLRYGG